MAIRTNKQTLPETAVVEETAVETEVVDEAAEIEQLKADLLAAKQQIEQALKAKKAETPAPPPVVKEVAPAPVVQDDKPAPYIADLKNAMDPELYGSCFPRIVGSNGNLICDKLILGTFIDVQVLSFSDRWMIVPVSDPKDKEARKFCRASYDGKTIPDRDGGQSMLIEEYTEEMSRFYKEFKISKYMDVFAVIFNADKNKEAGERLGTVQISVSPTAIKPFLAYLAQCRMNVGRGLFLPSHSNFMRIEADLVTGDKDNWTVLKPSYVPIDEVKNFTPIKEF